MLIIGCINVESALGREGGESLAGTSSSGKYAGVRGATLRSAEVRLILGPSLLSTVRARKNIVRGVLFL